MAWILCRVWKVRSVWVMWRRWRQWRLCSGSSRGDVVSRVKSGQCVDHAECGDSGSVEHAVEHGVVHGVDGVCRVWKVRSV